MQVIIKKMAIAILSIALIFTMIPQVNAQQSNTDKEIKVVQPPKLGTVTMAAGVKADVNGLMLIPSGSGQMASFTLSIHNESNKDINFVDYWAELLTKSGTKYNVKLASEGIDKVSAKSNANVQFYSEIGKNIKLSDLKVRVFKWDFSNNEYKRPLGTIAVPQRYNPVTPAKVQQMVSTKNSDLNFYVERAVIGKSEDYFRPDIKLQITNSGKKNVTLPDYQLSVLTTEGLIYQLTAKGLKDISLGPLMDKDFQLSGSIPIKVKEGKWKLVLSTLVTDKKIMVPLAMFDLPSANAQQIASDIGTYYSFANADGVYYVKLNSINRLPIEDQDIISANLTITNKGTETLPVPNLTGQFLFDDSIKRVASVLSPEKIIGIQPGQSIDISEMCKIPYTYDISKLELTIQEKDSESSEVNDLVAFTFRGDFSPIPNIAKGSFFTIQDIGYRSDVSIRKTQSFAGSASKIFAAQVSVVNKEKRLSDIEQLAGYFESKDGIVYPATVQKFADKILPGGNALLYVMASMPSDVETDNLKLVLGKAVYTAASTGTEQAAAADQLNGYVNAVSFALPQEQPTQENLNEIDISPFKLSLNNIGTSLHYNEGNINLTFDYNLEKNLLAKTNLDKLNLILEISDDGNNISYTKSMSLDDAKAGAEVNLEVGKDSAELQWTEPFKIYDISLLNKFNLNIYQELEPGQKKLLATEKFDWLVRNTK